MVYAGKPYIESVKAAQNRASRLEAAQNGAAYSALASGSVKYLLISGLPLREARLGCVILSICSINHLSFFLTR